MTNTTVAAGPRPNKQGSISILMGNQEVANCGKQYLMNSESMLRLIKSTASDYKKEEEVEEGEEEEEDEEDNISSDDIGIQSVKFDYHEILPHRVTLSAAEVTAALRSLYQKSRKTNHHRHHHHSHLSNINTTSATINPNDEVDAAGITSSSSCISDYCDPSPSKMRIQPKSVHTKNQLYARCLIMDDDDDDDDDDKEEEKVDECNDYNEETHIQRHARVKLEEIAYGSKEAVEPAAVTKKKEKKPTTTTSLIDVSISSSFASITEAESGTIHAKARANALKESVEHCRGTDPLIDSATTNGEDLYSTKCTPTINRTITGSSLPSRKDVATISSRKRVRECNDDDININSSITSKKEPVKRKEAKTTKKIYDSNWKEMFQRLLAYKDENNTLVVSKSINRKLSTWVQTQRTAKKRNRLSNERIDLLTSIGFIWDVQVQEHWHIMHQRLVAYKEENKTANVPSMHPLYRKLGCWVHMQRVAKKRNRLSAERIALLGSIDFAWDVWDEMYRRLCAYKEQHDSAEVSKYDQDRALRNWANSQRTIHKKGDLLQKREDLLNKIGFIWDPSDEQWNTMYQRLVAYKDEHNSALVPIKYERDLQLGCWIATQRTAYKNGRLSEQRSKLLDDIEFTWVAGNNSFIVI
jgi:hypothetical protein